MLRFLTLQWHYKISKTDNFLRLNSDDHQQTFSDEMKGANKDVKVEGLNNSKYVDI